MPGAFYQVWFAVRYIHIVSVTLLLGGALTTLIVVAEDLDCAARAAAAYEWIFWSVVGVTVVTGVSNLGLKGDGLLAPDTNWGTALSVKLAGALLLLAVSAIRSDIVVRSREAAETGRRRRIALTVMYGLTLTVLLAALWLGLGLAHGRY